MCVSDVGHNKKPNGPTLIQCKEDFFNDVPNTFYLPLYGVRHMLEDISDSKRGNPF